MLLLATVLGCSTEVAKQYEIDTPSLKCDEANRHVHDAVVGMGMTVTGIKVARMGSPGYVEATRESARGTMRGRVTIRCEEDGVHINSREESLVNEREFERGVYLGVTGRADLIRDSENPGRLVSRSSETSSGSSSSVRRRGKRSGGDVVELGTGVSVLIEPLTGFATVLDFEANLDAAGVLPVRVTISNGTERAYAFDARDVVLRRAGSRQRAYPMTPDEAIALLHEANRRTIAEGNAQSDSAEIGPIDATADSDLGDIRAATRIIPEKILRSLRLSPGKRASGFLYYPAGSYDRARVTMIDVATGETEGFIVEF